VLKKYEQKRHQIINLTDTGANKHRHPAWHLHGFIADCDDSFAMLTVKYLPHTSRQTCNDVHKHNRHYP